MSQTICCAQEFATANASVTIVAPLGISQTDNMIFGNVPVPGTSAGAVTAVSGVITQIGSGTLSQSTSSAIASYNVSGQASSVYNVTIPSTTVTLTNGSDTMTATTFTSTATSSGAESVTSTLSANGADVVKVGASLNVNTNQPAGLYIAANPFTITINYN